MRDQQRPDGVPADWVLGLCAACKCRVWYDPEVERAILASGTAFVPVCGALCAMKAVQLLGHGEVRV